MTFSFLFHLIFVIYFDVNTCAFFIYAPSNRARTMRAGNEFDWHRKFMNHVHAHMRNLRAYTHRSHC